VFAYRDKKVVSVFVRFRAPLHWRLRKAMQWTNSMPWPYRSTSKGRGYRIELGEIEYVLHAIAGMQLLLCKNDILIAYIVPDFDLHNQQDQIRLWRSELQSQGCLVPNVFHILDKMPVTAGDKIDRAALLEYQFNSERMEREQQHERKRRN
jgi:hypothetical protein